MIGRPVSQWRRKCWEAASKRELKSAGNAQSPQSGTPSRKGLRLLAEIGFERAASTCVVILLHCESTVFVLTRTTQMSWTTGVHHSVCLERRTEDTPE